ncbi:MAG: hypothetical protein E5Y31_00980 [Mesorhizobium sp.]|nr:MAG: hypothetical protein E5Y31_00980 [Mesorhizobium sp.]
MVKAAGAAQVNQVETLKVTSLPAADLVQVLAIEGGQVAEEEAQVWVGRAVWEAQFMSRKLSRI